MANNIREIITQAVIAKGKKRTLNKYPFSIEAKARSAATCACR